MKINYDEEDFLASTAGCNKQERNKLWHHHGWSVVARLQFDKVKYVVQNSLHIAYEGGTEQVLTAMLESYTDFCKIIKPTFSGKSQFAISYCLKMLQDPQEFARQPRSLKLLHFWKATEVRQFLHYTGIVLLEAHLKAEY